MLGLLPAPWGPATCWPGEASQVREDGGGGVERMRECKAAARARVAAARRGRGSPF
jgi:hypothetical protein